MSERDMPQAIAPRQRNLSTPLVAIVGLGVIALLALGFLSGRGTLPQVGDPAPDLSLSLFDGSEVSLRDLRGQVVVLNFWASWCGPCRREAPALQAAWEAYEDRDVFFLGVTYLDAPKASLAFMEEFGITYANGEDKRGRIYRAYGVTGVPETFIIDREGRIAWMQIGEVRLDELVEQLEELP